MHLTIQKISNDKNNVFILRDDLQTFSFGGNKYRKALLFFEEINKDNYSIVVTYGSSSSNHVRIISNLCAKYNKKCIVVCSDSYKTYNTKLAEIANAEFVYCSSETAKEVISQTLKKASSKGKTYFIPGGGHNKTGARAYTMLYEDVLKYEQSNNVVFDYIFLASGTGSSQAGLIIGKHVNNKNHTIIGVSIARKSKSGFNSIVEIIEEHNLHDFDYENNIIFDDNYTLGGYGQGKLLLKNDILEMYLNEGVMLDPVYTGKAFYGMRQYIQKNKIQGKNILFIHTGGTPLFFDFLTEIRAKEE